MFCYQNISLGRYEGSKDGDSSGGWKVHKGEVELVKTSKFLDLVITETVAGALSVAGQTAAKHKTANSFTLSIQKSNAVRWFKSSRSQHRNVVPVMLAK